VTQIKGASIVTLTEQQPLLVYTETPILALYQRGLCLIRLLPL